MGGDDCGNRYDEAGYREAAFWSWVSDLTACECAVPPPARFLSGFFFVRVLVFYSPRDGRISRPAHTAISPDLPLTNNVPPHEIHARHTIRTDEPFEWRQKATKNAENNHCI